jgi:hypothetical protein
LLCSRGRLAVPHSFIDTRSHYPFSNGDHCRPCVCGGEGLLESCAIPATLGVGYLFLDGKGIRGIVPGTCRDYLILELLDLSYNNISALPVGAFYGSRLLGVVDLPANAISTLEAGVFDGAPTLRTIVLRDNPLMSLCAGALAGLDELRNLFLDGSGELRVVEPGMFADTPRMASVWVAGSALNCTRLGLPGGVTCFDDVMCDVEQIAWIGNHDCDDVCEGYNTAECAWDGGDCM